MAYYKRYEDMLAPARIRPEPWRLGVGIILCILIMLFCSAIFSTTVVAFLGNEIGLLFLEEMIAGETKRGAVLLLLTYGFMAVGPFVLCQPLHGRSAWTLFGPTGRAALDFVVSVRGLLILYVVLFLIPSGLSPERVMGVGEWLLLLPVSLIAILVQTSSEEILFRGYFQTELAARFETPLVWMLLPGLLFAFGHYAPEQQGENAPWIFTWAFLFSLVAADLTARTGTLGAAMALHFINNVAAIALVSVDGPLSGLALYQHPFGIQDVELTASMIMVDFGVLGVSWLAIRLALKV